MEPQQGVLVIEGPKASYDRELPLMPLCQPSEHGILSLGSGINLVSGSLLFPFKGEFRTLLMYKQYRSRFLPLKF